MPGTRQQTADEAERQAVNLFYASLGKRERLKFLSDQLGLQTQEPSLNRLCATSFSIVPCQPLSRQSALTPIPLQ